jgi:hypothetical protein
MREAEKASEGLAREKAVERWKEEITKGERAKTHKWVSHLGIVLSGRGS